MDKTNDKIEKKIFDYTKLVFENDNEGTWIVIGISLFMMLVAIWIVFF